MFGTIDIVFVNETASSMFSLLGRNSSIKALRPLPDDESERFASLMVNSVVVGNFITSAHFAANGMFYVIDTLLEPPSIPLVRFFIVAIGYY